MQYDEEHLGALDEVQDEIQGNLELGKCGTLFLLYGTTMSENQSCVERVRLSPSFFFLFVSILDTLVRPCMCGSCSGLCRVPLVLHSLRSAGQLHRHILSGADVQTPVKITLLLPSCRV
jgi:hypothetical protein